MSNSDPYTAPESTSDSDASTPVPENTMLRPGVTKMLAVAWNLPVIAFFAMSFTGHVSFDDFSRFALLLCAVIPFTSLAVAFVPVIQRLLFVPDFDVQRIRPMRLGTAAVWAVITFGLWWTGVMI